MFKTKTRESAREYNQRIGQALRGAREAKGMSWAEVTRDCKLQEKFLQALEEGHTAQLPPHIYFRMFARTYAESLGLDADQLLGRLHPELPEPEFAPERKPQEYAELLEPEERELAQALSDEKPGVPLSPRHPQERRPTSAPIVPTYPAYPAEAPYSGPPGGSRAGMSLGYVLSGNRALVGRLALGALGFALVFVVGKYVVLNNGFASQEPSGPAPAGSQDAGELNPALFEPYQPRPMLELTIRAREKTAVLVIADGDTLFNRDLRPGEALTWKSNYRFKIRVENKNRIDMFIDGQPVKELPGPGKTLDDFEINQLNFQNLLLQPASARGASPGGASPGGARPVGK
ncbi:MAG: helix-turn-helix domain-containing protein [Candidatus Zixiibacteriota bacterium]